MAGSGRFSGIKTRLFPLEAKGATAHTFHLVLKEFHCKKKIALPGEILNSVGRVFFALNNVMPSSFKCQMISSIQHFFLNIFLKVFNYISIPIR